MHNRESILSRVSVTTQTIVTVLCFAFAKWFTESYVTLAKVPNSEYQYISILMVPIWFILLDQFGLGRILRIKQYTTVFVEYFSALVVGNVILYSAILVLGYSTISREVLGVFFLVNLFVLYANKLIFYSIFRILRRKGYNTRHVLIIADDSSSFFIDRLRSTADWGYKVFSIMTDSEVIKEKYGDATQIIPYQKDLHDIIDDNTIDEVMYTKRDFNQDEIKRFVAACAEVGVMFHMQSQLLSFVRKRSTVSFYNQIPFLTFRFTPDNYFALKLKGIIDFVASGLILIAISPVFIPISILIWLEDRGPVFFKQTRVGLSGRHFGCLKFRTMVTNAEELQAKIMDQNEQEGPVFKMTNDPRVTKIGQFLRKTSLDELPQFINVFKGDMSIVGPRPPVPSEVEQYERWQMRRLSMKPGITCIWQVSGRNNIPFEQWMRLDMQYIDNWSLKLDLMIFIKTIKVMINGDGK